MSGLPRRLATPLIWLVVIALGGVTLAQGIADLTRETDPALAARWAPWDPQARLNLAEDAVRQGDLATGERIAREAALLAPLDSSPFRLLGQIALARQDLESADRWMTMAVERSRRDTVAQLWIFARAHERGDFETSFRAADAVLRRRSDLREQLFPALIEAASTNNVAYDELLIRFSGAPSWREPFVIWAASHAPTSFTSSLLRSLRAANGRVSDQEASALIRRLINDGAAEAAYLIWLQQLPADARDPSAALYDGGFDGPTTLAPFGWTLRLAGSSVAERAIPTDRGTRNDPALYVSHSGSSASPVLAEQLLILPPGSYELRWSEHVESGTGERLAWTLQCTVGGALLVEVRASSTSNGWTEISERFEVLANCPAQRLALHAEGSDRSAPVVAWFDDLSIVGSTSAAAGES